MDEVFAALERAKSMRRSRAYKAAGDLLEELISAEAPDSPRLSRLYLEHARICLCLNRFARMRDSAARALASVSEGGRYVPENADALLRIGTICAGDVAQLTAQDEEIALWSLRSLEGAGTAKRIGYQRLLDAAAPIAPMNEHIQRRYLRRLVEDGRAAEAMRILDTYKGEIETLLRTHFRSDLWKAAGTHASHETLDPLQDFVGGLPASPEASSLRRLLGVVGGSESEETFLPEDREAVAGVLRHSNMDQHPNFEGYARAVEAAMAAFPDDAGILRLYIGQQRRLKRFRPALEASRRLMKQPEADISDFYNRVDLLNKLGRSATVSRYRAFLHRVRERSPGSRHVMASRLWAAHQPGEALETLGLDAVDEWKSDPTAVAIALRSLVSLRRYTEAQQLADRPGVNLDATPQFVVRNVKTASRYLETRGLDVPAGTDSALAVVTRWIDWALREPPPAYDPVSRRVLLSAFSLGIGGSERQLTSLATALSSDAEVESVDILFHSHRSDSYETGDEGSRIRRNFVHDIDAEGDAELKANPLLGEVAEHGRLFGLNHVFPIVRALHVLRPEVIHVRGGLHAEVALAGMLSSSPRTVLHYGSMTRGFQATGSETEMLRQRLVERICAKAAERPSMVLMANSRVAAEDWASKLELPPGGVGVLYNGLDEKQLGFDEEDTAFVPSAGRPLVVGGVFRLDAVKDPMLWLDVARIVAKRVSHAHFLIVGDGPLGDVVRKRIDQAGLADRFEMPGVVKDGLASFYRRMDVFLLTSKTESLPNVVIEAQLAGVPVVAPVVGGMEEAVASLSTAHLPERTAEALAEAVIRALEDEDWRRTVKETAPGLIRARFSLSRMLEATRQAYGWSG